MDFQKYFNYIADTFISSKTKEERELKALKSLEELVGISGYAMFSVSQIYLAEYNTFTGSRIPYINNTIKLYVCKGNLKEINYINKEHIELIVDKNDYLDIIKRYNLTAKEINKIRDKNLPDQKLS